MPSGINWHMTGPINISPIPSTENGTAICIATGVSAAASKETFGKDRFICHACNTFAGTFSKSFPTILAKSEIATLR